MKLQVICVLKLVYYHVHGAYLSHVVVLALNCYSAEGVVLEHRYLKVWKADISVTRRILYCVIAYLSAEAHLALALLRRYLVVCAGYRGVIQFDGKLFFRQIHICKDRDELLLSCLLALLLGNVYYVKMLLSCI